MTRATFLTVAVLLACSPAYADNDYETANNEWNGLSRLSALARGSGLEVVQVSRINWNDLGADDIVFMLYPTDHVEPNDLAAFIRNGGRVLFADDFGRGNDALQRLSMLRQHGVGVNAAHYSNLEFAPVALPLAKNHPLAVDVDGLTCNHPAVLTSVKGPEVVFGFGPNEAVVVAGAIGSGRFVALSDPSILINRMLEFEGNLQFAINLFRFLSRARGSARLVILVGDFFLVGEPRTRLEDDGATGLAEVNRWLEELNDYFMTENSLRIIGVLLALGLALVIMLSLPVRSKIRLVGTWTKARPDAGPSQTFHELVSRYDGKPRNKNWMLPAAVLRDGVVDRLHDLTGLDHPLKDETLLYSKLAAVAGPNAVAELRRIHSELRELPTRGQAASNWHPPHLSRRDFDRLNLGVAALYRILDANMSSK